MIEVGSNGEIKNAANNRQDRLVDKVKEKPITFLPKSTNEKQEKKASIRALNKNIEKNDETENEREWVLVESEIQTIAVETNGTKVFETKPDIGERTKQVIQMLRSRVNTSFKKRIIERRLGTTPTETRTHVSDCTNMTCVTYDKEVPQSIPVSKISVDRGKEQNANRHAAPYSAASGTVKSFKKINNDTNGCNNDGVEKTSAMWKKKAEQDVPVDATLNAIKDKKIWEQKMMLFEIRLNLRVKEFETVEIEDDNQTNKPKYHTTGSETNSQTSVPPAEDEVFAEAGNGRKLVLPVQEEVCTEEANRRKEVLLVEEGMFTDGTNERKQVLPVRIESHKESPDKEIIALQREGKSITLLLTDYQQNVQVLQRMSKTMLTQTISLAACTNDLDLFQQDLKKNLNLRELWKTINLGDVWKALRNPVLKNLSIWPHGRMVRTYDSTRTDWLTELYGERRSFVYNYKFSFLFFVQFRFTLSHWQGVVKINVLFVNPLIMTEEILSPKKNGNRNIHPKISTMSLTFHDNDDPGPRQRIAFQSRPQTGIVKTSLQFDANKKSEWNVMEKPPVLKAMRKKVDNGVVMKYTHTNYGRKNGIEPNCRTLEILFFKENALKKTPNRIVKTLLDFDVENALSKAPVLQVMGKELEASHTESILLEYRADTELNKYDRQNGTQPDRKTFDARPLNKNTPRKTPLREKLCTVSETNDETRCISQPMEHKDIYSIYLNSIAINRQVPASKTTCAKLDSAPNIHQRDYVYCTGGSNDLPVERYDEESSQWRFVEPTPRLVKKTSAAVVNNRIYVADYKGVLCYDIQKDSCSEMNLSYQWHFVKGGKVKILAVNEKLYIIRNESVFKTAMYLLKPEAGQMTSVKDVKDNAFFNNNFLAVPEKRPTAEEVLNKTQQFDLRFLILDPKKVKLLDSDLNEVDVITLTEKSEPFLKNKAAPIQDETYARRGVVRERREVGPTTRLDPHQGVIREWKVHKKAFNDNPTMNT